MPSTSLDAALQYREKGLSVIPCGKDKAPLIKWLPYQEKHTTKEEILTWTPDTNIGIVTGKISGVTVFDFDSQEGIEYFLANFKGITPCADTPRGMHAYFQYEEGTRNTVKVNGLDIDVRSDGGYIVAPPSINAEGKPYRWIQSIFDVPLAPLPDFLKESIKSFNKDSFSLYRGCKENVRSDANSLQFLTLGTRDNDLFHIVNCLIKGGCEPDKALQVLEILANSCNPPFPEREVREKIKSVLSRCERKERNLTEDLKKWIDLTSSYFSLTETYEPLQVLTSQKNTVYQIMHRLMKEGYVERHPNKNGTYRRIDREIDFMDFANADSENHVDLRLPLNLHVKTKIFPKGVVVVAGVSGTGKTLFAFNAIAENMGRFPIFYFNSEMGPEALKEKLSHFPIPISEWNQHMKVVDNWDFNNIADKIQPDAFNVVDYLEPEGEKAFNIHAVISAIIRRLNKGTALITIQKKPDAKMGTGGIYSIKAATLALALDWGKIEIVKNRFREADITPSLTKVNFEVHQGFKFVEQGNWYK